MNKYRVLLTSVGNDGFPSVLEAFKSVSEAEIEVIGLDARRTAAGLYLADEGYVIEPRHSASHIDKLRDIIKKTRPDFFWPLSTEDQVFYASNYDRIADLIPRTRVILSDEQVLRTANNKFKLFEFVNAHGIGTIWFRRVTSLEEIEQALPYLNFPEKPFLLKTDEGTGAQGVKVVYNDLPSDKKLFDRHNLKITYDEMRFHLGRMREWPAMHVTEFLPGEEFSVDVLCNNGTVHSAVVRRRDETIFGLALTAEVVKIESIEQKAVEIVRALGLSYVVNLQFRLNEKGEPQIIEINPRIPGTIGLSVLAGVNMPYLALKMALGQKVPIGIEPQYGRMCLRHWSLKGVMTAELKQLSS